MRGHAHTFKPSLDPGLRICRCGAVDPVYPAPNVNHDQRQAGFALALPKEPMFTGDKSEEGDYYDDQWDDDAEYDNAPPTEPPTGVIDREEYFYATYDYDDDDENDDEPPF